MKWKIFYLVAILAASNLSAETYDLVRIPIADAKSWQRLAQSGIALEEGVRQKDGAAELILSSQEIDKLQQNGFEIHVVRRNMEEFFRSRLLDKSPAAPFASGSMGGNLTFQQVLTRMSQFRSRYGNIISLPLEIGTSVEGRPILAYRISDRADTNEPGEPQVLYTALHHAREPQSMMTLIYFIEKLLQGYSKNPEITYLVNNRELWFIPVVNPDGYVFNETQSPRGGGMWRKNRRNNGSNSFGVDLNRNYGYQWGADDSGSSRFTQDETYRGTAPFSEPETSAVRDFVKSKKFQLALNYHSFRDVFIYPWGYKADETPHARIFRDVARQLTQINGYNTGIVFTTLRYLTNGEADDWYYGDTASKNRVFAMTPEIGGFEDGFWPRRKRILALAKENYEANLWLAWYAGGFPVVYGATPLELGGNQNRKIEPGERASLRVFFRNMGLRDRLNGLEAVIRSQRSFATVVRSETTIGSLAPFRNATRTFEIQFAPNAPRRTQIPFSVTILSNGTILRSETIFIVLG